MMKKRTAAALISLMLMGNTVTFADAPNGIAIIGNKAYSLKYINAKENREEIREAIRNKKGEIFVKNRRGDWYRNTGVKPIEKDIIPGFIYKSEEGNFFRYDEKDGDLITLEVKETKVINKNEIEIVFSGEVFEDVAKNKDNYLLFGKKLDKDDEIIIMEDGKTIRIKFKNEINIKKDIEIKISKNITFSMKKDEPAMEEVKVEAKEKDTPYYGGGSTTPSNSVPKVDGVKISGNFVVQSELKLQYNYSDKENDKEGATEIRWYRASKDTGEDKVLIESVNGLSYTLVNEDIGKYIFAEVTPVAETGKKKGTTVQSEYVGPVEDKNAAPVVSNIVVNGETIVEKTLDVQYDYTDKDGDAEGATEIKWYRAATSTGLNKVLIGSGKTYTLKNSDLGEYISAEVTPVATKGEAIGAAVMSGYVGPVKNKDSHVEDGLSVDINGYDYVITLAKDGLQGIVSMRVVSKSTGQVVDSDVRTAQNGMVTFARRLEKSGQYTVIVNVNGQIYEKDFVIESESSEEDTVKPIITLIGDKNIKLNVGDVYTEMGARATDNLDGDITDKIVKKIMNSNGQVVSAVDTSKEGAFAIYYMVQDAAGNEADMIQRTIQIQSGNEESPVNITVVGHELMVTLQGENLKSIVTMKIFEKKTGKQVDIQTERSQNNRVQFQRRIDTAGEYLIRMNAFNGEGMIERTFIIK